MSGRPDREGALSPLRPFQRRTVAHIVTRLLDPNGSKRFLVADEVGLGKTLVARGVVAEFVDRHWESAERLDILYVCSNSILARENLKKIRIGTEQQSAHLSATRFTLLATQGVSFHEKLNFISLTPGTAMRTRGMGRSDERVVLYQMLRQQYGDQTWIKNLLQGQVKNTEQWRKRLREAGPCDAQLTQRFLEAIRESESINDRIERVREPFARSNSVAAKELDGEAFRLIGELRGKLAHVCIDALAPDLIILDEFQRFKDLLTPASDSEEAELAQQLFSYRTPGGNKVALLLLSATPYRMFTTNAETAAEDHHQDFFETVRFLIDSEVQFDELRGDLEAYRRELVRATQGAQHEIVSVRARLERRLLTVMCRKERVASTQSRDAMVVERHLPAPMGEIDVRQYFALASLQKPLGTHDLIELWKSAPYLLNFAKNYQFKSKLAEKNRERAVREPLGRSEGDLLQGSQVEGYEPVDLANGRMRALADEVLGGGQWKMLWLPPSLPYWPLGGPWRDNPDSTKKLIFSAWDVVPDAVSSLLSYESERRMVAEAAQARNLGYHEFYRKHGELLRFTVKDGQPQGMNAFGLLLPCLRLAEIHPLSLCSGDVRTAMRAVVEPLLDELSAFVTAEGTDRSWFWAALLLLDADREELEAFLKQLAAGDDADSDDPREADEADGFDIEGDDPIEELGRLARGRRGLRAHVERALEVLRGERQLGSFPEGLADLLVSHALGNPAILWARTLANFQTDRATRRAEGAKVGDALRNLFNEPHSIEVLRREGDEAYWRSCLHYAIDGNLQALLDEYAHQLWEPAQWKEQSPEQIAPGVTAKVVQAVTARTSRIRPDYIKVRPASIWVDKDGTAIRTHFALRYDPRESERSQKRSLTVQDAFQSPFYPFVLASTSVGQEGIDFHAWCHSVWHWNLPGNPVDLEQREGRVHRYKGHAVRKNVAAEHGAALRENYRPGTDPWALLFQLAEDHARSTHQPELVPCWLAPGPAKVERCVPILPLSREGERLESLKRSLAIYRVVFGQPRQEELVKLLQSSDISQEELDSWVMKLGVG